MMMQEDVKSLGTGSAYVRSLTFYFLSFRHISWRDRRAVNAPTAKSFSWQALWAARTYTHRGRLTPNQKRPCSRTASLMRWTHKLYRDRSVPLLLIYTLAWRFCSWVCAVFIVLIFHGIKQLLKPKVIRHKLVLTCLRVKTWKGFK